jgi:hypothetical protein
MTEATFRRDMNYNPRLTKGLRVSLGVVLIAGHVFEKYAVPPIVRRCGLLYLSP